MGFGAGDLDQRVSLQRAERVRDGAGGASTSWSSYATVWAMVRPMTGRERENASREEALTGYLVVIRYRGDVLESDRLLWDDRTLNIRFLKRRGRAAFLEIEAEMGAS